MRLAFISSFSDLFTYLGYLFPKRETKTLLKFNYLDGMAQGINITLKKKQRQKQFTIINKKAKIFC